jgi:hypothetical protein
MPRNALEHGNQKERRKVYYTDVTHLQSAVRHVLLPATPLGSLYESSYRGKVDIHLD